MKYVIQKEDDGKLLRELLRTRLCLSSAFIKHLKFLPDGITVNGAHATVRHVARIGEVLELADADTQSTPCLTPTDIPLSIIYEDDALVLPSKPAFMPTHPSHLHHGDTLADALAFRYQASGSPFVFRPISRLDRNTSGLTLIARDRRAASILSRQMQKGEIKKHYIALLCGTLPDTHGEIETYITRTEQSIIVRQNCPADAGGDYALTRYEVLLTNGEYSLLDASPITGRTHQLRVHFSGLGAPILGDDIYGTPDSRIGRHALHAISLEFKHPFTHEKMLVYAPLHDDMRELVLSIFPNAEEIIYKRFGKC